MTVESVKQVLQNLIDLILLHSWKLDGIRTDDPNGDINEKLKEYLSIESLPLKELIEKRRFFDIYMTFSINEKSHLYVAVGFDKEKPDEYYLELVAYFETPNGDLDLAYINHFKLEDELKDIIVDYMRNVFAFENVIRKR